MEWFPSAFGLSKPVGNRVETAACSSRNGYRALFMFSDCFFDATLPRANAIGTAENRGRWHGG